MSRTRFAWLTLVALSSGGCRDAAATLEPSEASHRLAVTVSQRFDIVTQTIGPGEYAAPPAISPAIITYLGVDPDGTPNPGGPRQRFHFRAMAPGEAVVTFTHTGSNRPISDTITVR